MSFANVHVDELNVVAEFFLQLFKVPKLSTIWPSGKAPEDKHHGFLVAIVAERKRSLSVRAGQREIGGYRFKVRTLRTGSEFTREQPEQEGLLRWSAAGFPERDWRCRGIQDAANGLGIERVLAFCGLLEDGEPFFFRDLLVAVLVESPE